MRKFSYVFVGDLPAWIYYLQGEEVEEKPAKK